MWEVKMASFSRHHFVQVGPQRSSRFCFGGTSFMARISGRHYVAAFSEDTISRMVYFYRYRTKTMSGCSLVSSLWKEARWCGRFQNLVFMTKMM